MSPRRITSLTALLSFMALAFTSVVSYLAPRGPGSSSWEALGMDKHRWFALHTDLGVLFLVACIVHTLYNIKPIIAYMKNTFGHFRLFTINFNIALALTLWMIMSSLFSLPPVSAIQRYKESRGNRERHHPEAVAAGKASLPANPPFFYSRKSLGGLCEKYHLNEGKLLEQLERLGIKAQGDWSIKRIAEENDMASESVYEAIKGM
ncbi:hypothetical protein PDESU_03056 [Pontiella desulfatans]|uniref:Flavinylation-associated cytochrome domain-containing protein n=1 Tax=Pontiella desulfatans TaxID=2750659 RepID=A0A6C2U4Q1_PONDE|nr:DUF4405 domain-containing protein [Pontiella desulfatans]VGO14494.1 hypothetical protein PDESU_03056 [Pontiella desulfatans]